MSLEPVLAGDEVAGRVAPVAQRRRRLLRDSRVLIGAVIYLARHGGQVPEVRIFHDEVPTLRGIPGVVDVTLDWRGRGIIELGLLTLLATPIARVVFSVYAFIRQRDRLYVGVTLIVLAVLLYSVIGGYV